MENKTVDIGRGSIILDGLIFEILKLEDKFKSMKGLLDLTIEFDEYTMEDNYCLPITTDLSQTTPLLAFHSSPLLVPIDKPSGNFKVKIEVSRSPD